MKILNLYYSFKNISASVSLISIIINLIILLVLNKTITKYLFKIIDYIEPKIIKYIQDTSYGLRLGEYEVQDDDILNFIRGSDEALVYGPNNLLKYQIILNSVLAFQMIIIGIVYILSDYHQISLYKKIKQCL